MTSGGPNHATEVMSTYMYYQSFNILNYGYASAIGVVLMLLCMLSVGISNRSIQDRRNSVGGVGK